VSVPFALAEAGARLTQWLPNAPLTADQVRLLMTDKVIRDPERAPPALGVRPQPLDAFLTELSERGRR
jgi:NADH dehydrogenase